MGAFNRRRQIAACSRPAGLEPQEGCTGCLQVPRKLCPVHPHGLTKLLARSGPQKLQIARAARAHRPKKQA